MSVTIANKLPKSDQNGLAALEAARARYRRPAELTTAADWDVDDDWEDDDD